MNKGKYIGDLAPGDRIVESIFAVSNMREFKEGFPRLSLDLSDRTGKRQAVFFNYTPSDLEELSRSSFMSVTGMVQSQDRYVGQIKIERVTAITDAIPADDFIAPLDPSHVQFEREFGAKLRSVTEPRLRRLLVTVFKPEHNGIWNEFRNAVAAKSMHHEYRGGLLVHTLEVADLCNSVCAIFPSVNRDFVVTCALLHDIGKIHELDHGLAAGEYTEAGTLVGHIQIGVRLVRNKADAIDGFPESLKDAIEHMILSHHGRVEHGAARVPARPEALILSQCDLMSAKIYQYERAKAEAMPGQYSAKVFGWEDTRVHIGDLDLITPAAANDADRKETFDAPEEANTVFVTEASTVRLLVRGRVAAGDPGRSGDDDAEYREVVPPQGGADYLLHVTGDSMSGAGIIEGDLLFVKSTTSARDGELIVAHVAGSGEVVKRLLRKKGPDGAVISSALLSENPAYAPIPLDADTRIQGRVVGVYREI